MGSLFKKNGIRRTSRTGLLLALCVFLLPLSALAQPFTFDGVWSQRETGGDVESVSTFSQLYNLGVFKDLSAGTRFTGGLRYSETNPSNGSDQTLLNPSVTFDVLNDWSSLNLNATSVESETEGNPTFTTKSWNVNWSSLLEEFPRLRLGYGKSYRDNDASPQTVDSEGESLTVDLEQSWDRFSYFYAFRLDSDDDAVNRASSESKSHLGRLDYSQAFLENRVSVSASGQLIYREFKREIQTISGSPVFVPLPSFPQALSALDDTPGFGALATQNGLIDGNQVAGVVEILQQAQDQNFGLQTGLQPIKDIRVILDRDVPASTRSQLSWEVYTSSNNLTWTQILPVTVAYATEFVVTAPATVVQVSLPAAQTVPYIKLVVISPGAPAVPDPAFVTEIEAGSLVSGAGETIREATDTLTYKADTSVTYRPTDRWSVSYSGDYTRQEEDSQEVFWSLFQSLSSRYAVTPSSSIFMGINESRNNNRGLPESITRAYSLAWSSKPLASMDYSVGFTRSDSYEDSARQTTTDSLYSNAVFLIFPDLSLNAAGAWARTRDIDSGDKTTTYTGDTTLTARVSPKLLVDFDYNYSRVVSDTDDATANEAVSYGVGANYRPSDLLSFQGNLDWDLESDETLFTGTFFWRWTHKIQTNGGMLWVLRGEDEKAFNLGLNWAVSRHFTLDNRYQIRMVEDEDTWDFFSTLNAHL